MAKKMVIIFLLICAQVYAKVDSVAIFYTKKPPLSFYFLYDWIILEPTLFSPEAFKKELFWLKRRAKLIGYLSVGEVLNQEDVPLNWILGKNPEWNSFIIDIRKKQCQEYILSKAKKIIDSGFEGLMLDTLDSYQMVLSKDRWSSYEKAEIGLIKRLRKRFKNAIIIVNRPFNIIKDIADIVDAFLVEDIFYRWDFKKKDYIPQEKEETLWLLKKLKAIKKLGLPVIVVDYVKPEKRDLARKIVRLIKKEGFIPWVADKDLSTGIGIYENIPRKVLFLYDKKTTPKHDPAYSDLHLMIQMPVEWLGFVPVLKDISELPEGMLKDRYCAVFVGVSRKIKNFKRFHRWILKRIKEGIKVFFINGFGFPLEKKYLEPLEIEVEENKSRPFSPIRIVKKASFIGYETEPEISYTDVLLRPKKGKALILAENEKAQKFVPLALTPWGGYALEGSLYVQRESPFSQLNIPIGGSRIELLEPRWALDPFIFFKKLLKPDFPVPDITTEDGKRLLIIHVDGDAFPEPAEFNPKKIAAEVLLNEIFKVYHIPQSVSVIEGEIAPWGINPKSSKKLENIAKKIFSLSWIEPASHTFSHPFAWQKKDPLRLPIPNYKFDLKREIIGSVRYVRNRLAPEKHTPLLLFWSGDCMPSEKALSIAYKNHILSINGGNTTITSSRPILARVSPMGVNRGEYFQVYAPVMNENVYTNDWHGPYDGFLNVISTFKLTEKPRRLKPINIYYHFFSGKKLASLSALKKVYNWALSQDVKPIFISDYIMKVLEFRETAIAKDGRCWIIRNSGRLRTFRMPASFRLDKSYSKGIKGSRLINKSVYLSGNESGDYLVCPKD